MFLAMVSVSVKAGQYHVFSGYCKTEHELSSERRIYVWTPGESRLSSSPRNTLSPFLNPHDGLHITWMIHKSVPAITQVKIINIQVINLSTGKALFDSPFSIPITPLQHKLTHSLVDTASIYRWATWTVEYSESLPIRMPDYVDYRLTGTAIELDDEGEVNRIGFDIFLMRDYKAISVSDLPAYWTAVPSILVTQENSAATKIATNLYDTEHRTIITIVDKGYLLVRDGELHFEEVDNRREAFFMKTTSQRYEWIDGELRRIAERKRIDVDPAPYAYRSIYDRGFGSEPTTE
jgi:hypothetical protein